MKTLIFNGSPRKNGGTAALICELKRHLSGEITVIDTYRAEASPCLDCRYCWEHTRCVIDDEMQNIYRYIDESDNIVIASPVYFAELTGPLLSLMSRLQYFWVARNFRGTEVLSAKPRKGAVILVDAGDRCTDAAMAMAKRLLRIMGAPFVGSVYFSGTENVVRGGITVPESILKDIRTLAVKLTDGQIP